MRDGGRWGLAILLGLLFSAVLAGVFWATGSDATTSLLVGASAWPFLLLGASLVLRYRGDQASASSARSGITTDEGWRSLRRTIAGREVPTDPRVRREAVVQLRRSAGMTRTHVVVTVVLTAVAILQTGLALGTGSVLVPALAWLVAAMGLAQVALTRIHGRRADELEATPDDPPSAI
ncbi:hypothetical protein [Solicola sp. PLA-1-18]|uniref:hypothetical protein n=1 Tax=Solicola sp. PLA-1-18 TaxID=3380532 RepID=UPI003B76DA84